MTELLYQTDSTLREFDAIVTEIARLVLALEPLVDQV
jgi:Ser-tRNA(Ala) deacylase AlaX